MRTTYEDPRTVRLGFVVQLLCFFRLTPFFSQSAGGESSESDAEHAATAAAVEPSAAAAVRHVRIVKHPEKG